MSEIGELEALAVLVGFQQENEEERQWPVMALLSTIEILMDYYVVVEGDDDEQKEGLEQRAVESIFEQIHNWLIHGGVPMTEEERVALEDQEVAAFSDKLNQILGLKLDDSILLKKDEEEKKEDGNE